jgi:hypothetical protein
MAVVFLGVLVSSVPMHGDHLLAFSDIQAMLQYVAGLLLVILSAFCLAALMSYQELAFTAIKSITPLQLASFSSLLSAAVTVVAAAAAQALPGYDNGCQVLPPPTRPRANTAHQSSWSRRPPPPRAISA